MPGTFTVGEHKIRPGVYQRRYKKMGSTTAGTRNGIGLGVVRANWGPLNTIVDFTPDTNINKIFGSGNTEGLISEMFAGGLTSGHFVRIGSGGTAPTITLKDNTDPGVSVVTITGAYVGNLAFSVSIRDSLTGSGRECIIYEGTVEFCKIRFSASGNQCDNLIAAINANTTDFIAVKVADGSRVLATCTQTAMTPGTQPTVATTDYSAGLNVLHGTYGNCLCVDTDDVAVHALVQAWIDRVYANGYYCIACLSEPSTVELDTRMAHAASYNSERIVYVLNAAKGASGTYAGWKNAARIGGMIASVASNVSLTHEVIPGYVGLAENLTPSEIETALQSGCLVLSTNAAGNVWIEQGINTLVNPDGSMDDGWKKIRRVKTRFELQQRVDDTLDALVGKIDNDADGRATVISNIKGVIAKMVGEKKLISGDAYEDETNPAQAESSWYTIEVFDRDSTEKVYLGYMFNYSAD